MPQTHEKIGHALGLEESTQMRILPNAIYRLSAIPIKPAVAFLTELEQKILKFVWRRKKTPNSQSSL